MNTLIQHTHASHWLYEMHQKPRIDQFQGGWLPPVGSGTCSICLSDQYDTIRHFHHNTDYTNYDLHADNRTKRICLACLYTFQNDYRCKYLNLILNENGLQLIKSADKQQFVEWLWNSEKQTPFAATMTQDYKKHVLFRSPIQYSPLQFQVAYGETLIWIDLQKHQPVFEAITRLRAIGVPLVRMKTQQFSDRDRLKYTELHETWETDLQILFPYRYQPIFDFLCGLTTAKK